MMDANASIVVCVCDMRTYTTMQSCIGQHFEIDTIGTVKLPAFSEKGTYEQNVGNVEKLHKAI